MIKRFFWWVLGLRGWTFSGELPSVPRAVLVVAPHTSNWDMPILLLYRYALGIPARYLAKHSLFWWPLGPILRATGAIPVDRRRGRDAIAQVQEQFAAARSLYLALAPEGTRSFRAHWKSGFYRIAMAAEVPLLLVSIDYARRRVRLSGPLQLSGVVENDMAHIRHFFAGVTPRHPAQFGPVILPEESASD